MLCYFEDTDVSIRLLKYGYDLIENGYIYIVHKESQECKSIRNNIFYLSQHMKNYIMSIWLNIPLGVFILLSLKYFCHLLPLKAFQLKMNIFTVYKIGVQSYRY